MDNLYRELPFEVRRTEIDRYGNYEVTIAIKPEFAGVLLGSLMPLFQQIEQTLRDEEYRKADAERCVGALDTKFNHVHRVALKTLRHCRKNGLLKEEILNDVAVFSCIEPRELLVMLNSLEKQRTERYIRFRERHIVHLYHQEQRVHDIARICDVSPAQVLNVIKKAEAIHEQLKIH